MRDPSTIIVDGGPHTLWWSTQLPQGTHETEQDFVEMPIPLLLHELQPQAKLLVTLREPVSRMYSDYNFLTRTGVSRGDTLKSADDFHALAVHQRTSLQCCFETHKEKLG